MLCRSIESRTPVNFPPHPFFFHTSVNLFLDHSYTMPSLPSRETSIVVHPTFTEPPFYFVEPGVGFEIQIIGYGLRVNHFDLVVGGINLFNDGPRQVAYQLIYCYRHNQVSSPIRVTTYFIGGRPEIHFLCEDLRTVQPPIIEYVLQRRRRGQLILRVYHGDATRDPRRTRFAIGERRNHPPDGYLQRHPDTPRRPSSSSSDLTVQAFDSDIEG
jgi:hypothetical protein